MTNKCEICGKVLKSKHGLRGHLKSIHNIKYVEKIPKILVIFTNKYLPPRGLVYTPRRLKQYCSKYEFVSQRLVFAYPKQDTHLWRLFQQSLGMLKRSCGLEFSEIDEDDIEYIKNTEKGLKAQRSVNKNG